eukprot:scaffold6631_cov61-Phaeocystis_antarctica.AAC.1
MSRSERKEQARVQAIRRHRKRTRMVVAAEGVNHTVTSISTETMSVCNEIPATGTPTGEKHG